MVFVYELITAFTAGLFVLYLLTFFLRLKRKMVLTLASNALIGSALYVITGVIWGFSQSAAIDLFLCGISGVVGFAAITALSFL